MLRDVLVGIGVLVVAVTGVPAAQGQCELDWVGGLGLPGVGGNVYALTTYDDGTGAGLYAAGEFAKAAGVTVNYVAKWDGLSWSPLGAGLNDSVSALVVYDDGSGAALYAAGTFTTADGASANHIARWDGTAWSPVGGGLNGGAYALAVYDDGDGAALYVGGWFTEAGGASAQHIAKWDGAAWSAVGGADQAVLALTVFDDGGGDALYAGGYFTSVGGTSADYVARWDGESWAAVGSGVDSYVYTLGAFDLGGGEALYVGGEFLHAGGVAANSIARWDGTAWSALGSGTDGVVSALTMFDDGSGGALYVGGWFTTAGGAAANYIARWDGASWGALDTGMSGGTYRSVEALAVFDDGSGEALHAGGQFFNAGAVQANRIAKWDGGAWSTLGKGMTGAVQAMLEFAGDPTGLDYPRLCAAGYFTAAGGTPAQHIASWDGMVWSPLGSGLNAAAHALAVLDTESGDRLYAGGAFTAAGGLAAQHVGMWDGEAWSALGEGTNGPVYALAGDDAYGLVYAGGVFAQAGGSDASNIACWDGTVWTPLGAGVDGRVNALLVAEAGDASKLYVGGTFTEAGGQAAAHIACWDGEVWTAVGGGLPGEVLALAAFNGVLYAGGAGASGDGFVAKWADETWAVVGTFDGAVRALKMYEDGGWALYAGGAFMGPGGLIHIAKWDGEDWQPLHGGIGGATPCVNALADYEDDHRYSLFAGGLFTTAGGLPSGYIAQWGVTWVPTISAMPAEMLCGEAGEFALEVGEYAEYFWSTGDETPTTDVTIMAPEDGVWTESHGADGSVIRAESVDGGAQWSVDGLIRLGDPVLVSDTVGPDGTGQRVYWTEYAGGMLTIDRGMWGGEGIASGTVRRHTHMTYKTYVGGELDLANTYSEVVSIASGGSLWVERVTLTGLAFPVGGGAGEPPAPYPSSVPGYDDFVEWGGIRDGGVRVVIVAFVTDAQGCYGVDSIELGVLDLTPAITATPGDTVCDGEVVTLDAGIGYAGYRWSTGETSRTIEVTTSGAYGVEVTDENGCVGEAEIAVTVHPLPVPMASNSGPVCRDEDIELEGGPDGMVEYRWSGPDGWTSSEQDPVLSPGVEGTYCLMVVDENGCESLEPVCTVVEIWERPVAEAPVEASVCAGDDAALIGGPEGMAEYYWTGPGEFESFEQDPILSPAVAGTYCLTVTDGNGCVSADAACTEVTVWDLPIATAESGEPVCAGGDVQLYGGPDGMANYWWTGPNEFESTDQSPLLVAATPGEYCLTVKDGNGCVSVMACTEVVVWDWPVAEAPEVSPVCAGENVQMTGGPGEMEAYFWTGPDGFESEEQNPVLAPAVPGEYCLTVRDSNGCYSAAVCTEVVVWERPVAQAATDGEVGFGTDVQLHGGPDGMVDYYWTGPDGFESSEQSPVVSPAVAGTYCLMVVDDNCESAEAACTEVVVAEQPVAVHGGPYFACLGGTLQLAGSGDGGDGGEYSFAWFGDGVGYLSDPEVADPVFDVAAVEPGQVPLTVTVSLVVTDGLGGVSEAAPTTITVNEMLTVDADGPYEVCAEGSVELLAVASGGDGDYTYEWGGQDAAYLDALDVPNPVFSATVAGLYYLEVWAHDSGGCVSLVDTTHVVVHALPVPTADNNGPKCDGDEIHLTGGPDGMVAYHWTGPGGYESFEQSPLVLAALPGEYCLEVTDEHGCKVEVCTDVEIWELPVAVASTGGPVCTSQPASLIGEPGGMAAYEWTGPDGYTSDEQNPVVNPAVAGEYCLVVTDENECHSEAVCTVVVVWDLPVPTADYSGPVCEGESIQLFGGPDGMAEYRWSGPSDFASTDQNPTVSPAVAGFYYLEVVDEHGCVSEGVAQTEVVVHVVPVAVADNDGPVCGGEVVQLSGEPVGMREYQWSGPGGFVSSEQNPEVTVAGEYFLTVISLEDCTSETVSTIVVVNDPPDCTITAAIRVPPLSIGNEVSVPDAGPGAYYAWTLGGDVTIETPDPQFAHVIQYSAGAPGTITIDVEIEDNNECVCVADTFFVTVLLPICEGDLNCDGLVDYDDIDLFVIALSCVGGDPSCWPPAGVEENCPWLNADCDGDGLVTYTDIDAFVGQIGTTCGPIE